MPKICGRKVTSLTSFLFLYTIYLIAIVPRLAVSEKNIIMKQNYLKELMTALLLLCCTAASAYDFKFGGIYFNILSSEDKTVEVTSGSNKYTGAVTIPASVTYKGITYSVTRIGREAFRKCDGLTSIEIPEGVTSIGRWAFSNCYGLTSIEIPEGVTSIGDYAFYDCNDLTIIEIPSSVTSIGNYAFCDCSGLTSIEIPSSVTSIGNRAFYGCFRLTSIEIPSSVTSIGESAFCFCDGLTSIEIPSSVTSIGNRAFYGCFRLTSIEIPSSVTSIGESAFCFCDGLTSITSHIAAENLFVPGYDAFYYVGKTNCTLYVPAGAKSTYESTDGWKDFKNIVEMSSDGSDATAIESVETESTAPAVYYDLSGRRVENPTKGIYIVNGRKVFIK